MTTVVIETKIVTETLEIETLGTEIITTKTETITAINEKIITKVITTNILQNRPHLISNDLQHEILTERTVQVKVEVFLEV